MLSTARLPGGRQLRHFGSGKRAASPLVEFQLDTREVKHMSPHVLSAAVASAGAGRHRGDALWRAYGERALALQQRFTLHDVRLLLQGHADSSVRDQALFETLLRESLWSGEHASPQDLCSIAVALAKLKLADASAFQHISDLVLVHHLQALSSTDLGTLVNAFSRAACCNGRLFSAVAGRFQATAAAKPHELSPAAVTLALNAFAVCAQWDAAFWEALLNSVVMPRIGEFTVKQAALIANSMARCVGSVPAAAATLRAFADHWVALNRIEQEATTEDLPYLAGAFSKLRLTDQTEFNLVLAARGLQLLSSFTGGQLATFCSALSHLPSSAGTTFLTMTVHHALADALSECNLADLGLLASALTSAQIVVPLSLAIQFYARVADQAQHALSSLGREAKGEERVVTNATLASLAHGLVAWRLPATAQHHLAALRPLAMALAGAMRPRTVAALTAAHAHFRVDAEFLEFLEHVSESCGGDTDASGH